MIFKKFSQSTHSHPKTSHFFYNNDRQFSLFRVFLETNSQNRAVSEIFPRGCFFCTYPTWEAPVELATSCMCDKWRALDESANMVGASCLNCKSQFPLARWLQQGQATAAPSGSSSSRSAGPSRRCRKTPLPLAFPASWRRCFHWRVVLLL